MVCYALFYPQVPAGLEHIAGKQAHETSVFLNALFLTTNFFCNELKCHRWQIRTLSSKSSNSVLPGC